MDPVKIGWAWLGLKWIGSFVFMLRTGRVGIVCVRVHIGPMRIRVISSRVRSGHVKPGRVKSDRVRRIYNLTNK